MRAILLLSNVIEIVMSIEAQQIGQFNSINELRLEVQYKRNYNNQRIEGQKNGLPWAVNVIKLYFRTPDGDLIYKPWSYSRWKDIIVEYEFAKQVFSEFGLIGYVGLAKDAHQYQAGNIEKAGEWSLKVWEVGMSERKKLSPNELVNDVITRFYIRMLLEGKLPWREPLRFKELPYTLVFGNEVRFQGINLLTVLCSGMTYGITKNQVEELGGELEYNAKKWPMVRYKWYNFVLKDGVVTKVTYIANMWIDEWGNKYKRSQVKQGWFIKPYYLYDAETQVNNIEAFLPVCTEIHSMSSLDFVDKVIEEMGAKAPRILRGSEINYYNMEYDTINIGDLDRFESSNEYCFMMFRLLAYSVFRFNRLNKDTEKYDLFLVTEFVATFLCAEGRINPPRGPEITEVINQSLEALKNDRNVLIRSAQVASKIVRYILNKPEYDGLND